MKKKLIPFTQGQFVSTWIKIGPTGFGEEVENVKVQQTNRRHAMGN
jgi:hypothetical protein